MAIIECFECKKHISDKAAACPGCGVPVAAAIASPVAQKAGQSKQLNNWYSMAMICVVLFGIWSYHGAQQRAAQKEQARLAAIKERQAQKQEEAAKARLAREKTNAAESADRQRRNEEYAKAQEKRLHKEATVRGVGMLINQLKALDEVNQVASATPRIALSTQIPKMQAILRETESLPITGCLVPAQRSAVDGMRELTQAYLSFMRQDSNALQISRSVGHLQTTKGRMDACIAQTNSS